MSVTSVTASQARRIKGLGVTLKVTLVTLMTLKSLPLWVMMVPTM